MLIADPAIILGTLFFGVISLATSFFDASGHKQNLIAQVWAKTMLWFCGIRLEVRGLENIDPQGSYVFVANHLSYMDTPVTLAAVPNQFRFLAKSGLFKIPLLGTHLRSAGHIPVPREDPRAAVKIMQLAADTIKQKQISMLIFPEGGRSRDGVLQSQFKEGGAYIAIRAGVPLVPTVLIATHKVLPFGGGVVQSGVVKLHLLKPIPTADLTLKDRGAVTRKLRELIAADLVAEGYTVSPAEEIAPVAVK
jgi:1-acyl-sn-glycerol-3-phosphate acyltransferase